MRVVLDTNILTRAAGSRSGPAGEAFERVAAHHVLVVSLELLTELARVMSYPRVRQMHRLDDAEIETFLEGIETGGSLVPLPKPIPRIVPHDADDDAVVATAVAGQAEILCTRNRHLFHRDVLDYCRQHGVEVMDDIELLRRLRQVEAESANE